METVTKFKLWSDSKNYTCFIFLGDKLYNKHKKIIDKIESGKKLSDKEASIFPKHLWHNEKNIKFINKQIHKDDNINMLVKRVCVYLKEQFTDAHPDDIYMWIEKPVIKNASLVANFISNCFQTNKNIPFKDLQKSAASYFNIDLEESDYNFVDKYRAFKIIMDSDIKHVIEPLQFKYTYNNYFKFIQYNPILATETEDNSTFGKNSYFGLTLQYFGDFEHINIILYRDFKDKPWFFPYHSKPKKITDLVEYIEDLDMMEDSININTDNCSYEGHISMFQFKSNEINFNSKSDLGKAFDILSTSELVPFMKYKTFTNVFYKVDKDFIKNYDNYHEYWTKWTELTGIGKKFPENTSIVFKLKFTKNIFCSFRLYDNFVYDIKFAIGKARKTSLEKIKQFCFNEINSLLKNIRNIYPDSFIPDITESTINIVQTTTVDYISLQKQTIKYDNFKNVINTLMFPYFNIIPTKDKNIIQLQYKKVDNYLKYDMVTAFIINKPTVPKDELVLELSKWFRISLEDAENEYEKRAGEIVMEREGKFFKPKNDGFVNIKVKLASPDAVEFEVSGFKYIETHTRIVDLMKILINLTHKNITIEGIDIKRLEKELNEKKDEDFLKLKDIEKDLVAEADIDADALEAEEKLEYAEDVGEVFVDNEFDADFLDIVEEFKGAPEKEPGEAEEKEESFDKKRTGYFSTKLQKTDHELFGYSIKADKDVKKRRLEYSTLCSGRYPVVLNKQQKENIDRTYPGSYNGYLKIGSTPELADKNYYICPSIWCPKSMISMTPEQYKDNKCPFEGEEALTVNGSYWKNNMNPKNRIISVLDPFIHPKKLCIPCCFKGDSIKGKHKTNNEICKKTKPDLIYFQEKDEKIIEEEIVKSFEEGEEVVEAVIGNPKYIKGKYNWPLHAGHLGLLPSELYTALGSKRCGDRNDGTGNMLLESECFLRRGTNNKDQSFLACIVEILENPEFSSISELMNIMKNISIERFISLQNGKIVKVFVNQHFSIFDAKNFKEFVEWFLLEKRYAIKFNLGKVYRSLLNLSPNTSFNKDIRHYRDIIREFIIYNGFKHFGLYLKSNQIIDHRAFIDLINSERELINPKSINIVILELVNNKIVIQCPFNRQSPNLNHSYSFILKNGQYYELITKVKYTKNGMESRNTFTYKTSLPEIKTLIDFVNSNCYDSTTAPEKILADIELASGLKIKYLVLDYGFRIKGLLMQTNVYVPLENKLYIHNILKKKFIYYSDVINYKCTIDARPIFKKLTEKYSAFYKVKTVHEDYLILENDCVIPINIKKTDVHYETFEDDLEIFIENEKLDVRKNIVSIIYENKKTFSVFLDAIITYIKSNPELLQEINFISDSKNPFPLNFKRAKLTKLMEDILHKVIIKPNTPDAKDVIEKSKDAVIPCPDASWEKCIVGIPQENIHEFKTKVIEQLLINNTLYFENRTKVFRYTDNEFFFEHHEIVIGKHKEAIKYLQDPFKLINERLDTEFGEYVFSIIEENEYLSTFIDNKEYKNNYDKFKTIVRNTMVVDIEDSYTNMYMYQWFEELYKTLHDKNIDSLYLKNLVRTHVINDYETDTIGDLITNKSFENIWKEYKKKNIAMTKPSIDICETIFGSTKYYPSLYELKILSDFIGANVIIFKRSNAANPNGLEFINNRSPYYILFYNKFDNKNIREIYEIMVIGDENKKKCIFNATDLKMILKIIKVKEDIVEIDVDDNELIE